MPLFSEHRDVGRPLGPEEAEALGETMRSLATASRRRSLLTAIRSHQEHAAPGV